MLIEPHFDRKNHRPVNSELALVVGTKHSSFFILITLSKSVIYSDLRVNLFSFTNRRFQLANG